MHWTLADGRYEVNLISAKNRITQMKTIIIVRIELCAAIMTTRLAMFVKNELRYKFSRVLFCGFRDNLINDKQRIIWVQHICCS